MTLYHVHMRRRRPRIIRRHRHNIPRNHRWPSQQRHQQNCRQRNRLQRDRNRQRAPPNFSLALHLLRIVSINRRHPCSTNREPSHTPPHKIAATTWENLRRRNPAGCYAGPRRRARRDVRFARVLSCFGHRQPRQVPRIDSRATATKPLNHRSSNKTELLDICIKMKPYRI